MTELMVGERATYDLVEFDAAFDFTEAWLANRRFSENTREAYRRDVHQWLTWCAGRELDPLAATFLDANAWSRALEAPDGARKPLAPATVARKMSAVSSWYAFIVKLGRLQANPFGVADRPLVDRDFSPTVSFDRDAAEAMLMQADPDDPYVGAVAPLLAEWMVVMGTRATETTDVQVEDIVYTEGFWVVYLVLKGGRRQRRPLPGTLVALLEHYLRWRAAQAGCTPEQVRGPLFVNRRGEALNRRSLARFVRRLALLAGVSSAERITPHSFRHAWNGMAMSEGAKLEDRQEAMGHRDPRTTRRYDRAGRSLIRDPGLLVAAAVARRPEGEESA